MRRILGLVPVIFILAGSSIATAQGPRPTAASDLGKRAVSESGMVASAHPLASDAGLAILRSGGNAVDAAVAAAFAIGVVEPMMAGIGGSGSLMIWDQGRERADYLDFYSVSPAGVTPDFNRRRHPARIVAVPGAVAGLLEAHERGGKLSREAVLAPAIELAEGGFTVGSLLARTIADDSLKLSRDPNARRIFLPEGRPLRAGAVLKQPELAETLRKISAEGRDGFYRGAVAEEIIQVVNSGGNPMALSDLEEFTPVWRRPLCAPYRGWTVLSAPPPQSGMQLIEALKLLEPYDLGSIGLPTDSVRAFHLLTGALRVANADRVRYMNDPDRQPVPANGVISGEYAETRRRLLERAKPPARIRAGDPWKVEAAPVADNCASLDPYPSVEQRASREAPEDWVADEEEESTESGETTHLSVVDADGNAVALTYTQGIYFGSGTWAAGTFLNSSMNIFSANPRHARALGPRLKPVSTTMPTIILEGGRVRMVVGSPGGGRIPSAVTQAVIYTLDYGLDPLTALRMPRIHPLSTSTRVRYEQGFLTSLVGDARELGYEMDVMHPASLYFGGVHLIDRRDGLWVGAADPRRDGKVSGY